MLSDQRKTEVKAEQAYNATCAAEIKLETTGQAIAAFMAAQTVKTAELTTQKIATMKTGLTEQLKSEITVKVANSDTAAGSAERTELETELKGEMEKRITKEVTAFTREAEEAAADTAEKEANKMAETKKAEIMRKCAAAKGKRIAGYGQLSSVQEEAVKLKVRAALPGEMEMYQPSLQMLARLKESVYSSHSQNQVYLLDDGAASW